jgi:hypothetical protein
MPLLSSTSSRYPCLPQVRDMKSLTPGERAIGSRTGRPDWAPNWHRVEGGLVTSDHSRARALRVLASHTDGEFRSESRFPGYAPGRIRTCDFCLRRTPGGTVRGTVKPWSRAGLRLFGGGRRRSGIGPDSDRYGRVWAPVPKRFTGSAAVGSGCGQGERAGPQRLNP